jgi:hypothetical protein
MKDENFISRWSRRKIQAASKVTSEAGPVGPAADVVPAQAGTPPTSEAGPLGPTADVVPEPSGTLPPIESLTPESDFTPFMKPDVDEGLKRQALKQLFQDPQFNVMDGLDVYIDDYSKADPLPDGWLEKMNMVKRLGIFAEPAEGVAEDAPPPPEPLKKATLEQPVAPAAESRPGNPSSAGIVPPESGKS